MRVSLVVAVAMMVAGCGSPSAATQAPTEAPPTQAPSTPTALPASNPTEAPTEAPTTAPAVEPTATTPVANVAFNWAPGSVPPSDSDDVDIIAGDLMENDGITSVTGNETVLNVVYDPTRITVEEIMSLLEQMGHPVVVNE
jgi:hypothetical protein